MLWGGDTTALALHAFYRTTLPCFYNVPLAHTLSRVCILQSEHYCVLLHLSVAITCRFISEDEISCHSFVRVSFRTDGDIKLRQDLGVLNYTALASLIQHKAELLKWLCA